MTCFTITITDITKPVQSLLTLISQGNQPGYTVVPAGGISALAAAVMGQVSYCSIQSSPSNSATVYTGDEFVTNNGTRQGKEMSAGDVDVLVSYSTVCHLGEKFLSASANGAKINVEVHQN